MQIGPPGNDGEAVQKHQVGRERIRSSRHLSGQETQLLQSPQECAVARVGQARTVRESHAPMEPVGTNPFAIDDAGFCALTDPPRVLMQAGQQPSRRPVAVIDAGPPSRFIQDRQDLALLEGRKIRWQWHRCVRQ